MLLPTPSEGAIHPSPVNRPARNWLFKGVFLFPKAVLRAAMGTFPNKITDMKIENGREVIVASGAFLFYKPLERHMYDWPKYWREKEGEVCQTKWYMYNEDRMRWAILHWFIWKISTDGQIYPERRRKNYCYGEGEKTDWII